MLLLGSLLYGSVALQHGKPTRSAIVSLDVHPLLGIASQSVCAWSIPLVRVVIVCSGADPEGDVSADPCVEQAEKRRGRGECGGGGTVPVSSYWGMFLRLR